jgi:membrane protein
MGEMEPEGVHPQPSKGAPTGRGEEAVVSKVVGGRQRPGPQAPPPGTADARPAAGQPGQIPAPAWRDVAVRVAKEVKRDRIPLVAAGVAFYSMLALFPAMIAVVSIFGLVLRGSVAQIPTQVAKLTVLPSEVRDQLVTQLTALAHTSAGKLSVGLLLGLVAALWSTSSGMKHLIDGINVAYDETETRRFVKLRAVSMVLTLGAIALALVALAAIVALPILARHLPVAVAVAVNLLRWVLLGALVVVGLAVLYRYGPDRDEPRWRWASAGSMLAMVGWLVGSLAFSLYASHFANFNKTYGSLGAVIVLLLWLYLSSFVVLLGAQVNAQVELRTRKGATTGPRQSP